MNNADQINSALSNCLPSSNLIAYLEAIQSLTLTLISLSRRTRERLAYRMIVLLNVRPFSSKPSTFAVTSNTKMRKRTRTLWSITAKNTDKSPGPLARPFARSLAPLTCSLAPDCSLRSRPPLRSLVRSLAHIAHSLARGTVND